MDKLTEKEKLRLKQQLKATCITLLEQRINTARQAMAHAQDSANNGNKSSAGDKYETSRSMGQLDRDMNAKQLDEAIRELDAITALPINKLYTRIVTGAVVVCEDYLFFIALGMGTTTIDNKKVILLSPKAPIANILYQKKAEDTFMLNGVSVSITDVF